MDIILCGVVVEKVGEMERFCTSEAKYAIPLLDDHDVEIVDGIALCQEHSDRFDSGRSLIVQTRKGNRLLIRIDLNPEEDGSTMEEVDSSPPADQPTPTPQINQGVGTILRLGE